MRRLADVRVHFRADAGHTDGAELEAHHGRVVRRHRGRLSRHRAVRLRHHRRAHRLRPRAVAGGRALDGASTRGGRLFRHCRRAGRVRDVTARRCQVDAGRAIRQTGKSKTV